MIVKDTSQFKYLCLELLLVVVIGTSNYIVKRDLKIMLKLTMPHYRKAQITRELHTGDMAKVEGGC